MITLLTQKQLDYIKTLDIFYNDTFQDKIDCVMFGLYGCIEFDKSDYQTVAFYQGILQYLKYSGRGY